MTTITRSLRPAAHTRPPSASSSKNPVSPNPAAVRPPARLPVQRRRQRRERIAVHADLQARVDDHAVRLADDHTARHAAVADERCEKSGERAAHGFRAIAHPAPHALQRTLEQAPHVPERHRPRRRDEQHASAARRHRDARAVSASNTIWRQRPRPRCRIARFASSLTPESCAPMSAPRSRPSAVRYSSGHDISVSRRAGSRFARASPSTSWNSVRASITGAGSVGPSSIGRRSGCDARTVSSAAASDSSVGSLGERSAEITRRFLEIALLETEEAESLLRAAVTRREREHRFPLGACPRKIAAIDRDARDEIVRVRALCVAIESARRHAPRELQSAPNGAAPRRAARTRCSTDPRRASR